MFQHLKERSADVGCAWAARNSTGVKKIVLKEVNCMFD
jgi:hypothetical protein